MLSLRSSAEERITFRKQTLIVDLVRKSGSFWDALSDIRCRWGIRAMVEIPPAGMPFSPHMPPDAPKYTPQLDGGGCEEWENYAEKWLQELGKLHDKCIPDDCRVGHRFSSQMFWERFLSACVLYDPPDDQLEEYASRHQIRLVGHRISEGAAPHRSAPYRTIAPPIRWMRDAGAVEEAMLEVLNRFVSNIIEQHERTPDVPVADLIREMMRSPEFFAPVREDGEKNPATPSIQVKPWHTEDDIRNAFRMISSTQKDRPRRGRPKRNNLRAVQCASLVDRYGWTEDQVGDRYGWIASGKAGKYIRDGRKILGLS